MAGRLRRSGKWISEDATGMAQYVSERLGISERLVPKWSQAGHDIDTNLLESMDYMAVEVVSVGIVSNFELF